MDIKNIVLSYYKNSIENFHIQKVEESSEAQKTHSHEYFQIYFITKGNLTHYIGEEAAVLSYGDMFIIPPAIAHRVSFKPGTVFYSIAFCPDLLENSLTDNKLAKNFLSSLCLDENRNVRPKISADAAEILYIEGIMEHILKEFTDRPVGYYSLIQAYMELLVTILARNCFESVNTLISDNIETDRQLVLYSIEYIERNYTKHISFDEITKKSAMSKNKFYKLFFDITGYSFAQYINVCRIKKAAEYIRHGYKITAIYGLCGYDDFSTFYRNFKKIMGVSPIKYKHSCV